MIYKGIFWLIEGELYTKKLECDKSGNVIGDGSGLNSKSGDNFNHRLTWEGLELTRLFGLDELDFVRVKNDGSRHYRAYAP